MFESGTPRDRAEIAASEAEKAVGENRKRQLRRLCHQGRGGGEAFALAQDDVQDVGCFGRKRSETDRQQARARAERVNESTAGTRNKGSLGLFRETGRVRWWSVKCAGALGMARIKWAGARGKRRTDGSSG